MSDGRNNLEFSSPPAPDEPHEVWGSTRNNEGWHCVERCGSLEEANARLRKLASTTHKWWILDVRGAGCWYVYYGAETHYPLAHHFGDDWRGGKEPTKQQKIAYWQKRLTATREYLANGKEFLAELQDQIKQLQKRMRAYVCDEKAILEELDLLLKEKRP